MYIGMESSTSPQRTGPVFNTTQNKVHVNTLQIGSKIVNFLQKIQWSREINNIYCQYCKTADKPNIIKIVDQFFVLSVLCFKVSFDITILFYLSDLLLTTSNNQ